MLQWQDDGFEEGPQVYGICLSSAQLVAAVVTLLVDAPIVDRSRDVLASLAAAGAPKVDLRRVDKLGAGLRIRGGLACVDATIAGLLASRERVEAELLAELGQLIEQRGGQS